MLPVVNCWTLPRRGGGVGEVLQWPSVRLYSSLVWVVRVEESRVEREQDGRRSAERQSLDGPESSRSARAVAHTPPTPTPPPAPLQFLMIRFLRVRMCGIKG